MKKLKLWALTMAVCLMIPTNVKADDSILTDAPRQDVSKNMVTGEITVHLQEYKNVIKR